MGEIFKELPSRCTNELLEYNPLPSWEFSAFITWRQYNQNTKQFILLAVVWRGTALPDSEQILWACPQVPQGTYGNTTLVSIPSLIFCSS